MRSLSLIISMMLWSLTQVAMAYCEPDLNNRGPCDDYQEDWKESKVVIPPVAADSEFKELSVADANPLYRYYLAQNSITQGTDGVMHYSVAVVSKTGVRNIFYEGIHCETGEVKTYAYATKRGAFRRSSNVHWRPVANKGIRAYQNFLANVIICDANGYAWDADKAKAALVHQITRNGIRADTSCKDCDNAFRPND